jgi:hypothetical protein
MAMSETLIRIPDTQTSLMESLELVNDLPGVYWEEISATRFSLDQRKALGLGIIDQRRRLTSGLFIAPFDVVITETPQELVDGEATLVVADTIISEDNFPRGLVRLFARHVEQGISDGVNVGGLPLRIVGTLGHEGFHARQWKSNRSALERDLQTAKLAEAIGGTRARVAAWGLTRSELDAMEFEKNWLEHWMDYPKR